MAHGRSPSWAIPVHAILSVEQNKKKREKEEKKRRDILLFFFWLLSLFFKQESELRRGPKTHTPVKKGVRLARRGRLAWCLLCRVRSFARAFPSREAGAAKQNFLKKKHCVFLFN